MKVLSVEQMAEINEKLRLMSLTATEAIARATKANAELVALKRTVKKVEKVVPYLLDRIGELSNE